jgi:hypothetical protein
MILLPVAPGVAAPAGDSAPPATAGLAAERAAAAVAAPIAPARISLRETSFVVVFT